MRVHSRRKPPEELRRRLLRLEGLPLRPTTARSVIAALSDDPPHDDRDEAASPRIRSMCELDPGWVLASSSGRQPSTGLSLIAERPWWPSAVSSGPQSELLDRLWRHSVAVGIGARRLAREAGDPDPEAVARAGQLCCLGFWAVAAVEPDWLVSWSRLEDPARRIQMERADLGSDLDDLGRWLAERWGCDPLLVDAAWLSSDHHGTLNSAASAPGRLAMIQEAYRWAEQTPWALRRPGREPSSGDPRLRILMAEVQARCGSTFVDPEATSHEERASRQNARLRLRLDLLREERDHAGRFLELLAGTGPAETADEWADRAAATWCAEPGVGAARVSWAAPAAPGPRDEPDRSGPQVDAVSRAPDPGAAARPPGVTFPLNVRGPSRAIVDLWCQGEESGSAARDHGPSIARGAWDAWATLVAERTRQERRLQEVVAALRGQIQTERERLRRAKSDALGEFAGGAGHELNNPLAVIVGRAQLLLARVEDPEVSRSLRIILGQAQRAHRILRDLMFVARPPAPRTRACKPPEVLESLLAEFERDCAARGVRLLTELDGPTPTAWADPDGLRHLAEILMRNALQATPPGGRIHVRSSYKDDELIWSFSDTGKGIGTDEAEHLFDPFYCGRQAGRGLGLGLPRAAKIVELAGGRLRWSSSPGHETIFQVYLPLTSPPDRPGQPIVTNPAAGLQAERMLKS